MTRLATLLFSIGFSVYGATVSKLSLRSIRFV